MNLPETIYLIRGEDDEFGPTHVWCDDPAPDEHCGPAEAVEYVRKDRHDAIFELQAETVDLAKAKIDEARQIITGLIEFCERPEIVEATDGAFDPDSFIRAGKRFLGGEDA